MLYTLGDSSSDMSLEEEHKNHMSKELMELNTLDIHKAFLKCRYFGLELMEHHFQYSLQNCIILKYSFDFHRSADVDRC